MISWKVHMANEQKKTAGRLDLQLMHLDKYSYFLAAAGALAAAAAGALAAVASSCFN
jgi:hypothetical protein